MKILMVNKFFYIKGGSETYYFALKRKLEEVGHTVIDFSMQSEMNFASEYSEYFVNNIDYSQNMSVKKKIQAAANIIYSKAAKDKFEKLVIDTKPDIVHLHIFQHQISPSIIDICKKYNLPIVYTAHDLKMLCLNYKMMHHGKVCEKCKGGHFYNCVRHKCVKDSFAKSFVNMIEGYVHKIRKTYDCIDYIITPSEFYRCKFIDFGINPNRVIHIPNFLERNSCEVIKDESQYYLYLGRLSEEKGIFTLIYAMEGIETNLLIVGTGPLKEKIEKYVDEQNIRNVHVLGFKSGNELKRLVRSAKAVVLPSEWYENGPYSAIESLQLSRPIIGADIGGIPELINGNGFLYESSNVSELHKVLDKMQKLSANEYSIMEQNSAQLYEKNYTWEYHYSKLECIYKKAVEKHNEGIKR